MKYEDHIEYLKEEEKLIHLLGNDKVLTTLISYLEKRRDFRKLVRKCKWWK